MLFLSSANLLCCVTTHTTTPRTRRSRGTGASGQRMFSCGSLYAARALPQRNVLNTAGENQPARSLTVSSPSKFCHGGFWFVGRWSTMLAKAARLLADKCKTGLGRLDEKSTSFVRPSTLFVLLGLELAVLACRVVRVGGGCLFYFDCLASRN